MTERVITEFRDGIAEVILNRPEQHNGLDVPMFAAIVDAGKALLDRKDLRCVILRGEGKSFCAGLDFKSVMQDPDGIYKAFNYDEGDVADHAQLVSLIWRRVPVPVIAAIRGACLGGGMQLALGADIRIAAPDAKLSVMEINYGLIPDMGISITLPELVGSDVAKELTWTGRKLTGQQAAALGLVTHVAADPVAAARELAAEILTRSPDAIRDGKTLLNSAYELRVAQLLKMEADMQQKLLGSANQMAAVQATMLKQPPSFRDPA